MVADKHVPCRAWASLPTNYLYISKISDDSEGKSNNYLNLFGSSI